MSWNYRVVRFKDEHADTEEYYEIKEVFYDTAGKPVGYSDATCGSDTYDGLFKVMGMMQSAHAKFVIDEEEYWGVVKNIIGVNTEFKSEVFKDFDLVQSKEWRIRISGLVIKTIKKFKEVKNIKLNSSFLKSIIGNIKLENLIDVLGDLKVLI